MYQTINSGDFVDAFKAIRPDQFTYKGLHALFDELEAYEDGTGEKLELDVIALCCDYSEYADLAEFQQEYGDEYESIEDIEDKTLVIRIPDTEGFIIQAF